MASIKEEMANALQKSSSKGFFKSSTSKAALEQSSSSDSKDLLHRRSRSQSVVLPVKICNGLLHYEACSLLEELTQPNLALHQATQHWRTIRQPKVLPAQLLRVERRTGSELALNADMKVTYVHKLIDNVVKEEIKEILPDMLETYRRRTYFCKGFTKLDCRLSEVLQWLNLDAAAELGKFTGIGLGDVIRESEAFGELLGELVNDVNVLKELKLEIAPIKRQRKSRKAMPKTSSVAKDSISFSGRRRTLREGLDASDLELLKKISQQDTDLEVDTSMVEELTNVISTMSTDLTYAEALTVNKKLREIEGIQTKQQFTLHGLKKNTRKEEQEAKNLWRRMDILNMEKEKLDQTMETFRAKGVLEESGDKGPVFQECETQTDEDATDVIWMYLEPTTFPEVTSLRQMLCLLYTEKQKLEKYIEFCQDVGVLETPDNFSKKQEEKTLGQMLDLLNCTKEKLENYSESCKKAGVLETEDDEEPKLDSEEIEAVDTEELAIVLDVPMDYKPSRKMSKATSKNHGTKISRSRRQSKAAEVKRRSQDVDSEEIEAVDKEESPAVPDVPSNEKPSRNVSQVTSRKHSIKPSRCRRQSKAAEVDRQSQDVDSEENEAVDMEESPAVPDVPLDDKPSRKVSLVTSTKSSRSRRQSGFRSSLTGKKMSIQVSATTTEQQEEQQQEKDTAQDQPIEQQDEQQQQEKDTAHGQPTERQDEQQQQEKDTAQDQPLPDTDTASDTASLQNPHSSTISSSALEQEQLMYVDLRQKLKDAVLNFSSWMQDSAAELVNDLLLPMRVEARTDQITKKVLDQDVETMKEGLLAEIQSVPENDANLDRVGENDLSTKVLTRLPRNHQCPFCFCHGDEQTEQTLAQNVLSKEVRMMSAHCSTYVVAMGTLEPHFYRTTEGFIKLYNTSMNIDQALQGIGDTVTVASQECSVGQISRGAVNALEEMKLDLDVEDDVYLEKVASLANNTTVLEIMMAKQKMDASFCVDLVTECRKLQDLGRRNAIFEKQQKNSLKTMSGFQGCVTALRSETELEEICNRSHVLDLLGLLQGWVCPYCSCRNPSLDFACMQPASDFSTGQSVVFGVSTMGTTLNREFNTITSLMAEASHANPSARKKLKENLGAALKKIFSCNTTVKTQLKDLDSHGIEKKVQCVLGLEDAKEKLSDGEIPRKRKQARAESHFPLLAIMNKLLVVPCYVRDLQDAFYRTGSRNEEEVAAGMLVLEELGFPEVHGRARSKKRMISPALKRTTSSNLSLLSGGSLTRISSRSDRKLSSRSQPDVSESSVSLPMGKVPLADMSVSFKLTTKESSKQRRASKVAEAPVRKKSQEDEAITHRKSQEAMKRRQSQMEEAIKLRDSKVQEQSRKLSERHEEARKRRKESIDARAQEEARKLLEKHEEARKRRESIDARVQEQSRVKGMRTSQPTTSTHAEGGAGQGKEEIKRARSVSTVMKDASIVKPCQTKTSVAAAMSPGSHEDVFKASTSSESSFEAVHESESKEKEDLRRTTSLEEALKTFLEGESDGRKSSFSGIKIGGVRTKSNPKLTCPSISLTQVEEILAIDQKSFSRLGSKDRLLEYSTESKESVLPPPEKPEYRCAWTSRVSVTLEDVDNGKARVLLAPTKAQPDEEEKDTETTITSPMAVMASLSREQLQESLKRATVHYGTTQELEGEMSIVGQQLERQRKSRKGKDYCPEQPQPQTTSSSHEYPDRTSSRTSSRGEASVELREAETQTSSHDSSRDVLSMYYTATSRSRASRSRLLAPPVSPASSVEAFGKRYWYPQLSFFKQKSTPLLITSYVPPEDGTTYKMTAKPDTEERFQRSPSQQESDDDMSWEDPTESLSLLALDTEHCSLHHEKQTAPQQTKKKEPAVSSQKQLLVPIKNEVHRRSKGLTKTRSRLALCGKKTKGLSQKTAHARKKVTGARNDKEKTMPQQIWHVVRPEMDQQQQQGKALSRFQLSAPTTPRRPATPKAEKAPRERVRNLSRQLALASVAKLREVRTLGHLSNGRLHGVGLSIMSSTASPRGLEMSTVDNYTGDGEEKRVEEKRGSERRPERRMKVKVGEKAVTDHKPEDRSRRVSEEGKIRHDSERKPLRQAVRPESPMMATKPQKARTARPDSEKKKTTMTTRKLLTTQQERGVEFQQGREEVKDRRAPPLAAAGVSVLKHKPLHLTYPPLPEERLVEGKSLKKSSEAKASKKPTEPNARRGGGYKLSAPTATAGAKKRYLRSLLIPPTPSPTLPCSSSVSRGKGFISASHHDTEANMADSTRGYLKRKLRVRVAMADHKLRAAMEGEDHETDQTLHLQAQPCALTPRIDTKGPPDLKPEMHEPQPVKVVARPSSMASASSSPISSTPRSQSSTATPSVSNIPVIVGEEQGPRGVWQPSRCPYFRRMMTSRDGKDPPFWTPPDELKVTASRVVTQHPVGVGTPPPPSPRATSAGKGMEFSPEKEAARKRMLRPETVPRKQDERASPLKPPCFYVASPYPELSLFFKDKRSILTQDVTAPRADKNAFPVNVRKLLPPRIQPRYPPTTSPTETEMAGLYRTPSPDQGRPRENDAARAGERTLPYTVRTTSPSVPHHRGANGKLLGDRRDLRDFDEDTSRLREVVDSMLNVGDDDDERKEKSLVKEILDYQIPGVSGGQKFTDLFRLSTDDLDDVTIPPAPLRPPPAPYPPTK